MNGTIGLLPGRETSTSGSLLRMKRPGDAIAWWEIRRIPFNLFMLAIGLASLYIFMLAGRHVFAPDADFGSPFMGVIFYGLAANLCYTLGWITELLWTWGDTAQTEKIRSRVFRAGLIFSAGLTFLPAIVVLSTWGTTGFR